MSFFGNKFIVLYDGDYREGEADLVCLAREISPEDIAFMRIHAGGLICVATRGELAKSSGLDFFTNLVSYSNICKKMPYGDSPAFSLPINHIGVKTGISDHDRSLTIREFDKYVGTSQFSDYFYTPGHVFVLIARSLKERRGHTELSIELAKKEGAKSVVLCEMVGFSKEDAKSFASEKGFPFIEGDSI